MSTCGNEQPGVLAFCPILDVVVAIDFLSHFGCCYWDWEASILGAVGIALFYWLCSLTLAPPFAAIDVLTCLAHAGAVQLASRRRQGGRGDHGLGDRAGSARHAGRIRVHCWLTPLVSLLLLSLCDIQCAAWWKGSRAIQRKVQHDLRKGRACFVTINSIMILSFFSLGMTGTP